MSFESKHATRKCRLSSRSKDPVEGRGYVEYRSTEVEVRSLINNLGFPVRVGGEGEGEVLDKPS